MGYLSIIFGLLGLASSFFAYTVAISFISILGLVLALLLKTKNSKLKYTAIFINIIACLRLIYIIVVINMAGMQTQNTIFEYQIPKGYSGWVQIQLNVKDAPAISVLKKESKTIYQIIIPANGTLKTSTDDIFSISHVSKYFWIENKKLTNFKSRDHKTTQAWIHCGGGNKTFHRFYVFDKPIRSNDPKVHAICDKPPR